MRKLFTLAALCLATLCANAQTDYTIRTLTFEDADFKGDNPTFGGETNWSSLIDEPQYGGTLLYGTGGAGVTLKKRHISGQTKTTHGSQTLCLRLTTHGAIGAVVTPSPTMLLPTSKPMVASIRSLLFIRRAMT